MLNTEKAVRVLNENKFLGLDCWELYPLLSGDTLEFIAMAKVKDPEPGKLRVYYLTAIQADIYMNDYEHK